MTVEPEKEAAYGGAAGPRSIEELRALSEAATSGKWEVSPLPHEWDTVIHSTAGAAICWIATDHDTGPHHPRGDAAFIAAAVNYVRHALQAATEAGPPDVLEGGAGRR